MGNGNAGCRCLFCDHQEANSPVRGLFVIHSLEIRELSTFELGLVVLCDIAEFLLDCLDVLELC